MAPPPASTSKGVNSTLTISSRLVHSSRHLIRLLLAGQPVSVADWVWSLVREGQTLEVVEDGMPEKGSSEVLEKYVLIAVLCSHPQLHAGPTMDQVVKMLESNEFTVISIPQRPISLVACRDEIDRSVSSGRGSEKLTSPTGSGCFLRS